MTFMPQIQSCSIGYVEWTTYGQHVLRYVYSQIVGAHVNEENYRFEFVSLVRTTVITFELYK